MVHPDEDEDGDKSPVTDHTRHTRRGFDVFLPDKDKTVIPECHPTVDKKSYKEKKGHHHIPCDNEKTRN